MQLVIPIEEFNINNVYFNHPIPNNVLDGSQFSRVLYSDDIITFNGIYLGLRWRTSISSYLLFNKSYDISNNTENDRDIQDLINEEIDITELVEIEEKILNKLNLRNKIKVYQVNEQIRQIFNNLKKKDISIENNITNNHSLIFKCSGVWISDNTFGLTFKIIDNNQLSHQ